MRVLITGSSGQIGTNLGLALLDQGHEVVGVDKRANEWTERIATVGCDLARVLAPAEVSDYLSAAGPVADVVVHFAAYAKVHELTRYPHRALENMVMTFNVLEYCRQHNLPIILGSSRETYGNLPLHHNDPVSEELADHRLAASPYAASKLSSESLIYAYARCYDMPYIVFRFSNVYGRYDNDIERMERVMPLFIRKIAAGEPITVYGEQKLLDFTYVDDCVQGVRLGIDALVSGRVTNEVINLAYGQGHGLVEMAEMIGAAVGVPPAMTVLPSLVGEVTRYVADLGKARGLLGYEPLVSLAEGIPLAVAWNREWAARGGLAEAGSALQLDEAR